MGAAVPAIFMSGYSAVTATGPQREGFHYLAKPVRPRELLAKVRAALGDP